MMTQETSTIPQMDGLGSLPMRDPIGRIPELSRSAKGKSSQGGTYV